MNWLRYGIIMACLLGWIGGWSGTAVAVDRTYPSVDERVWVASIAEDRVEVSAPYLFHEGRYRADLNKMAEWLCKLYKRTAVPIYFVTSNDVCDTLGEVAAKRDSNCWHTHVYACAIP